MSDFIFELEEDYLEHYGTKRHSGRYPWGSGEDPYQHEGGIHGAVNELKGKGMSETEIANGWNISVGELKTRLSAEKTLKRAANYEKVMDMKNKGMSNVDIGKALGVNESTVRSYLDAGKAVRNNEAIATAKMLKDEIEKHGPTYIGKGTSNRLNITDTKLDTAVFMLQEQGYKVHNVRVRQMGTGKLTTMQVIAPPSEDSGKQWRDILDNADKIHVIDETYSEDGGRTWEHIEPPRSISSKRVYVRYAEDGGADKDGLIEIRPNVEDLDMGKNQYAQVRIAVDGTHYMKGMAVYNSRFPKEAEGYDIIYNSKKPKGAPFEKVFKEMKLDQPDNPFGALIKDNEYDDDGNLIREVGQRHYIDKNGKKQLSAINIINEEGNWGNWRKSLASQMLSKQSAELAERQLKLAYDKKVREFEEIKSLTNTAVQQKLLESFSSDCDTSAVHLKAAPLPGQRSHVIIPFPKMKDTEIYAPNYPDGTIVSLVRYPHEGTYQIPTLTVNNTGPTMGEARRILGNAPDAVGINVRVANILSGADFDGDTVLVIPNPGGNLIKNNMSPAFEELRKFDTEIYNRDHFPEGQNNWPKVGPKSKKEYDKNGNLIPHDGFKRNLEMGKVSNLITDMTLKKAKPEELIRATKHAMVVIDAEKHDLNWKQSYIDNGIEELKKKYQENPNSKKGYGGASTLISKAKSPVMVAERKPFYRNQIDPETGEIHWQTTGALKRAKDPKTGEWYDTDKPKTQEVHAMEAVKDANELSSGTIMENKYADYANKMKLLGNEARKYMISLQNMKTNKQAAKVYEKEVSSIKAKLNEALKNKPLENKAQAIAGARLKILLDEHPDMTFEEKKKHSGMLLAEARQRLGASKHRIKLTPKEWEAIQQGAISHTTFLQVLNNTDMDVIKNYATPRDYTPKLSRTEINYAKALLKNMPQADVAQILGVSVSTLQRALE